VFVLELSFGKHLDELRLPLAEQALDFVAVDRVRHRPSFSSVILGYQGLAGGLHALLEPAVRTDLDTPGQRTRDRQVCSASFVARAKAASSMPRHAQPLRARCS
jgi:hypothetical protein